MFVISDKPEIHSNNYHIYFDREAFMVEPVWMNQSLSSRYPVPIFTDSTGHQTGTILRLTLDDKWRHRTEKLAADLSLVFDEKLLMFLNKIKCMAYEDERGDMLRRTMHEKRIESHNWLFLKSSLIFNDISRKNLEMQSYWFTLRHQFKPDVKRLSNDEKETDHFVEQTEIAIAFKFSASGSGGDMVRPTLDLDLSEGLLPVYSFLPTGTKGKW